MNVVVLRGADYAIRKRWSEQWVQCRVKRIVVDLKQISELFHPGKEMYIDVITMATATSAMLTALKTGFDVCIVNDIDYKGRDAFLSYKAKKYHAKVLVKDFDKDEE